MFESLKKLFKRKLWRHKKKFDIKLLKKNNIHLLILDEGWNALFKNTPKTLEIKNCERKLKQLLKSQAHLIAESKAVANKKKVCMDTIINLTSDAFDKGDEHAKETMQACQKEINHINERTEKIAEELEIMPDKIRYANLELLEHTVNTVYFKMCENQKRHKELEKLIEETTKKLKEYNKEIKILSRGDTAVYTYFHDLLGGEEMEKLDKEFFGGSNHVLNSEKDNRVGKKNDKK